MSNIINENQNDKYFDYYNIEFNAEHKLKPEIFKILRELDRKFEHKTLKVYFRKKDEVKVDRKRDTKEDLVLE